ncbi:MAG: family 1 glycosylhydrolase [Anaerolineae bacterium]
MTDFQFPKNFLWGAATAAHQVEGNNVNSESWVLEHLPGTIYQEPSGDACDHYHRYREDIALLAELGFNAYRFSVEWSRIEPEEGEFSYAELEHYRRMLAACHEHGLTPMVTFHHFTSPRWLHRSGGWLDEKTPDRFARYCERVTRHLGDLIGAACTLNEPNISAVLGHLLGIRPQNDPWWPLAAQQLGTTPDRLGLFQFVATAQAREVILKAHRRGYEAIKSVRADFPLGLTLALHDFQAIEGGEQRMADIRRELADHYLEPLRGDDFVGVQNYARMVVGPDGLIPPSADVERNQMGEEVYPEALAGAVGYAAQVTGIPVYVTENGMATIDDTRRVEYFKRALLSLAGCIESGIDVRGYFCWSAMDNFEWVSGYGPKFGIIAVDRVTQARTPKPSAHWLGKIARANRLQG